MNKKVAYGVAGILVVIILLFGYFIYRSYQTGKTGEYTTATPTQAPPDETSQKYDVPQKGDIGYQEPVHTVSVGTEKISSGTFSKVEGGQIYYKTNTGETTLPMTDEVVLSCTSQNLEAVTELDFDKIVSIHPMTPGELGSNVPASEPMVAFAEYVEGILKVHTVAMSASSCGSL